jgi:UDP-N-acetylmuramoyl-L-alanyl-D-glutamate--2,6-diaminopimelate ligase
MAKIAARLSDYVIVTSDNPRTEDPQSIVNDICAGFTEGQKNYESVLDREQAIAGALQKANAGDVILVAGKGHEDYQIIGTEKKYFSDFDVARKYLSQERA